MHWNHIKSLSEQDFKRSTGVNPKTFKLMVKSVQAHDQKSVQKKGNNRSRPFAISIEDQILLTLMYYREYRTQFHIGIAYGLSESTVSRTISRIEGILFKCKEFSLPGKEKLAGTSQQYSVIVVDATESPIERPKKNNTGITQAKRRNTR